MMGNIVVIPGSVPLDLKTLQAVACDFGWAVKVDQSDGDIREAAGAEAVLFCRDALGDGCSWLDAARRLKAALPDARLIACHGVAETIDWPQLCDAGVFHALGLPLKDTEVRQSLGFISQAVKRLENSLTD
jgi:hypothetical protein